MHADGEKGRSEFTICVNLRHLRAEVFSYSLMLRFFCGKKSCWNCVIFSYSGTDYTDRELIRTTGFHPDHCKKKSRNSNKIFAAKEHSAASPRR